MHTLTKKLNNATACNNGLTSKFCLVLGLQWGREGKRKLLNNLCVDYDYSCRFNGGVLSEPSIHKCGDNGYRYIPEWRGDKFPASRNTAQQQDEVNNREWGGHTGEGDDR